MLTFAACTCDNCTCVSGCVSGFIIGGLFCVGVAFLVKRFA